MNFLYFKGNLMNCSFMGVHLISVHIKKYIWKSLHNVEILVFCPLGVKATFSLVSLSVKVHPLILPGDEWRSQVIKKMRQTNKAASLLSFGFSEVSSCITSAYNRQVRGFDTFCTLTLNSTLFFFPKQILDSDGWRGPPRCLVSLRRGALTGARRGGGTG